MSDTAGPARPRQLTMAAGFVIGGSILLVLTVFDTLTGLRSVEMRDELTETLSSPTFRDLGITVGEALTGMRVGLMVAGACAAATAVLGVYALQRSRPARLALSVLAVPILLTAPLTGGLMGALVAAAILMLWSGPARDWFAGRAVRQPEPPATPRPPGSNPWEQTMPGARGRPPGNGSQDGSRTDPPQPAPQDSATGPDTPPASSLSASGFSTAPGATTGFGERPAPAGDTLTRGWLPPAYEQVTRGQAPVTVKLACFLTWAFAGVVALLYAVMLVVLVVADQRVVDYVLDSPEWQRANLEQDIVLPVLWFGCLLFLGWSVAACVLAWFTWRRHNWARWMLTVSAVVTIIAATFAFPVGVLHQLAAILTVAGLFSAAARAWFDPRSGAHGPPSGPPSGWVGAHAAPAPDSRLPGPPPGSHPPPPTGQEQLPPTGGKPPVW